MLGYPPENPVNAGRKAKCLLRDADALVMDSERPDFDRVGELLSKKRSRDVNDELQQTQKSQSVACLTESECKVQV